MNPITLYKFMQAYPMETHKNTNLQIDKDLYLKYNYEVTETGGIRQNVKLLSKNCDKENENHGITQQYLAKFDCFNHWNGGYRWYIRNIRSELISIYAPHLTNLSINSYDGGRNAGEWIADALYYQLNPLEIKYKNGKFKRGVGSCLTRRLNGFAYPCFVWCAVRRTRTRSPRSSRCLRALPSWFPVLPVSARWSKMRRHSKATRV